MHARDKIFKGDENALVGRVAKILREELSPPLNLIAKEISVLG